MGPSSAGGSRLALRAWDDGLVVYDRICGATHALDGTTGRVFLMSLEHTEASESDLLTEVSALLPKSSGPELVEAIARARIRLNDANLLPHR